MPKDKCLYLLVAVIWQPFWFLISGLHKQVVAKKKKMLPVEPSQEALCSADQLDHRGEEVVGRLA